jgi:hypothetical protein
MIPGVAKSTIGTYVEDDAREASYRFAGLLIVSLFPALFWTTVLAFGSNVLGAPLSPLTLATVGAAIAALLAAVFNAIVSRV